MGKTQSARTGAEEEAEKAEELPPITIPASLPQCSSDSHLLRPTNSNSAELLDLLVDAH